MDNPEPLAAEAFDYTDGRSTFEGYLAHRPGLATLAPCVLVAHDGSGLNQHTRDVAEGLARLGYVALALDVYGKGIRGTPGGDNSALIQPLLADRVLLRHRLLAGLAAAQRHPRVNSGRMAVLGHCFGGLCALDLARAAPMGLKAAVSVHGMLGAPGLGEQPRIEASVLILHGWEDPFAPPADVLAVAAELTAAGADWQLHAFGHTMHSFTFPRADRPERGMQYHPQSARRAQGLLASFLNEHLG